MCRCEEYILLMNQYLDGELSPQEANELLLHLEQCPTCRKRFENIKIASYELRHMRAPVPQTLHASIMRQVRANSGAAKKRNLLRALGSLAACAAVVTIVVTGGLNRIFPFGTGGAMKSASLPQEDAAAPRSATITMAEDDENAQESDGTTPSLFSAKEAPGANAQAAGSANELLEEETTKKNHLLGQPYPDVPDWAYDHTSFVAPVLHNRTQPKSFVFVTGTSGDGLAELFPDATVYRAEETGEWYLETAADEETVHETVALLADYGYTIHDSVDGVPEVDAQSATAVFVIFILSE